MQKLNYKKIIGLALIFLALLVFMFEPLSGLTGFSIAEQIFRLDHNSLYIPSVLLFMAGAILLFLKTEVHAEPSVREAVIIGVPIESAKRIQDYCNAKAARGEWVQLRSIGPNRAKNRKYPDATSLCKYWGPGEYGGKSTRELTELYEQGKLGKTHEIYRGSDEFSQRKISHPRKYSRILHRHWEIAQMHKNGIMVD